MIKKKKEKEANKFKKRVIFVIPNCEIRVFPPYNSLNLRIIRVVCVRMYMSAHKLSVLTFS